MHFKIHLYEHIYQIRTEVYKSNDSSYKILNSSFIRQSVQARTCMLYHTTIPRRYKVYIYFESRNLEHFDAHLISQGCVVVE